MPLSLDKALGIHAQALSVRSTRAEILANNIANADTPNYKAVDIDFKTALDKVQSGQMAMATTSAKHMDISAGVADRFEKLYRVPMQPALDGNTVETQIEQAEFTRNAVNLQASLTFLNGRISGLLTAIKGQ